MKKLIFSLIVTSALLISFSAQAACIDPATGKEYLLEDPNGPGFIVLSSHVEPGACMGCGDCIIPILV